MKNMLSVFAVERPGFNDWKFKEPKDMSFVKLYPDIVKEQEQAWESRGELVYVQIYGERSGPGMKNPPKTNTTDKHVSMEPTNKGVPKTLNRAPTKTSISDETREALLKALQKLFQTYKVCRYWLSSFNILIPAVNEDYGCYYLLQGDFHQYYVLFSAMTTYQT